MLILSSMELSHQPSMFSDYRRDHCVVYEEEIWRIHAICSTKLCFRVPFDGKNINSGWYQIMSFNIERLLMNYDNDFIAEALKMWIISTSIPSIQGHHTSFHGC